MKASVNNATCWLPLKLFTVASCFSTYKISNLKSHRSHRWLRYLSNLEYSNCSPLVIVIHFVVSQVRVHVYCRRYDQRALWPAN